VRAAALCDGTIRAQDLPEQVRHSQTDQVGSEPEIAGSVREPEEWVSLAAVEARYVTRVLQHTRGNKQAAARVLGVDRKTVERILRRQQQDPLLQEAS
jgi:transcriptional regulator of acetoin/glycerol metabolism